MKVEDITRARANYAIPPPSELEAPVCIVTTQQFKGICAEIGIECKITPHCNTQMVGEIRFVAIDDLQKMFDT